MRSKKEIRLAILKWLQTEPELILCGVRWYLRYSLSFRDAAELPYIMASCTSPMSGRSGLVCEHL